MDKVRIYLVYISYNNINADCIDKIAILLIFFTLKTIENFYIQKDLNLYSV